MTDYTSHTSNHIHYLLPTFTFSAGLAETVQRLTGPDHLRRCDSIMNKQRPGSEYRWMLVSRAGSGE